MKGAIQAARGHRLFVAGVGALALLVVITAWIGPAGCQSGNDSSSVRRPDRPASPLDEAVDLRRRPGEAEVMMSAIPELPEERPLPPSSEPMVRIRVAALRGQAAELSVPGGDFLVGEIDASPASMEQVSAPLVVRHDGRGWILREGSGALHRERRIDHQRPLQVRGVTTARGGSIQTTVPISYAGQRWPGVMRLHPRSDGQGLDLVVLVEMERYLPGVIAKELYRNWGLETYRAQAIAARSYAVVEAAHWARRRHFDMVAGEASQAWIGETDNPTATRAVSDTRGMLLVYDGRVVPAYYSSCCGGHAADAFETITRNPNHDIPPLALGRQPAGRRPNCCRQSPTWTWTERLPAAEVARRLSAWGAEAGRADLGSIRGLSQIFVSGVNAAGRTQAITVIDSRGTRVEIPAETFRFAINGAPADPSRSTSGDAAPRRTLKSSNVEVALEGEMVLVAGRGHGHGVGMCQFGAEAMARAGRSWRDILLLYYPEAVPSRCW
ncbi:MAG: SpoIID/LytB domain-containing protein [Phycisphaeraceae bacterium]|nr:SpoIID/LytB domain-containing protein [Phycisphaeraceae bacterium]